MTASILNRVDALLIDLDGTVYQYDKLLPGVGETLAWLRTKGVPLRFVTNSTMRSRSSLAARLRGFGVQAEESDILNPVAVAASGFSVNCATRNAAHAGTLFALSLIHI